MKRNLHHGHMSESFRLSCLLAVSGGLMDAYSYLYRDHVFANAQTGNILLFGISVARGDFSEALRYFFPFMAFACGIAIAEFLHIHSRDQLRLHWRQDALLIESLILLCVGFLPQSVNNIANAMISFACGIQVQSFRKAHGNGIATTMCIGNLRSGIDNLCHFAETEKKEYLKNAALYFGIILSFLGGAVIGRQAILIFSRFAIEVSVVLLLSGFAMMFADRTHKKRTGGP